MQRLFIVGAGGFGREVLGWALHIAAQQPAWDIAGFLDANPAALDGFPCAFRVCGDPAVFVPTAHDVLICAIGDPATKLRLCRALQKKGGHFITFIHPTAVVGPDCCFGAGCILGPGAVVTTNVTLGNFVTLNVHATIGHDVVVGDGCTLSSHADVTGRALLGEGVFLGSHAAVLPNAQVGDYALVGAGSVVLRKVRPYVTVMGVPAKPIFNPARG